MDMRKGREPDPEIEISIEDLLRLRDQVQRGHENLFMVGMYITYYGKDQSELTESYQVLRSFFQGSNAKIGGLRYRQLPAMHSTLPLASDAIRDWQMVDTSSVAVSYPFSPPDMDNRNGTLIGLDTRSKSLVTYDHFELPNMNTVVLATSGGGKSFFTKLQCLRLMQQGIFLYCVDPEGEYSNMARYLGGRVITPGIPGQGMNPFTMGDIDEEDKLLRIGSLRRLVSVMIEEDMSADARAALDTVLTRYYTENPDEEKNFLALHTMMMESNDPLEREIGQKLRPFATGSLRHLLASGGEDIMLDEPVMTVFDMHLLEPSMRSSAAMICAETVWAQAMVNPRKRIMVVDEVWSILMHAAGSDFLLNISKRARKHNLGLTSITQDVQDMLTLDEKRGVAGNAGRALIQNATSKMILRQDPAAIEALMDALQLTPRVARELTSVPTGNGLLITPRGKIPMQIVATPEEIAIIEWRPGYHSIEESLDDQFLDDTASVNDETLDEDSAAAELETSTPVLVAD
jgi:type IV secretory pathway VirB4 component